MKKALIVTASVFLLIGLVACDQGADEPKVTDDGSVGLMSGTLCNGLRSNNQTISYCNLDIAGRLRSGSTSVDIVYYWPSFGEDQREIFRDKTMTDDLKAWRAKLGSKMPVIVSLGVTPEWLIGTNTPNLIQTVLPLIEMKLAPGKTVRRFLYGHSTGARNALRLAAQSPSSFRSVAAACPALMALDPYVQSDIADYKRRHSAILNNGLFDRLIRMIKLAQIDSATWRLHDPLAKIDEGSYDSLPIWVSVSSGDSLGFAEGANLFVSRLFSRGGDVQLKSVAGGALCAWDRDGLTAFWGQQIQ